MGSGGGLDQTPALCQPVPLEGMGLGWGRGAREGDVPLKTAWGMAAWESLHWGTNYGETLIIVVGFFFGRNLLKDSE